MSKEIDCHRRLLCEPVTRPDGVVIEVYECYSGESFTIRSLSSADYTKEEAMLLGNGNPLRRILKVGNAYYLAPMEDILVGREKQLNQEIKWLKFLESNY